MSDYQVRVVVELAAAPKESQLDRVLQELLEVGGSVGGAPVNDPPSRRADLEVVLSCDAPRLAAAVQDGIDWTVKACEAAGLRVRHVVEVAAMTGRRADQALREPLFPQLAGPLEVAADLGVSRQRVYQLRERPDFPAPVAELAAGPVWRRGDLTRFVATWPRRPGRPPQDRAGDKPAPRP